MFQTIDSIVAADADSRKLIDSLQVHKSGEGLDGLLIYNIGGEDELIVEQPPPYITVPGI